jgi:integrase
MSITKPTSFRIGKVRAYLRSRVWYLCYFENGRRHRPRAGSDKAAARQLAAQINAQLEVAAPAALSFEPIGVAELRQRWLQHHEQVLRSSIHTINRYRTATDHLLRFLQQRPIRHASQFRSYQAGEFVRYLRAIEVSPNGHAQTKKRPLLDKGVRFVLECCRSLFNFAAKRRHLSPYAPNPFSELEIDRIPVEQTRPIVLFSPDQEREFLECCDEWQFPLFLTLMLTGLRSGELTHLLLPDDLDLNRGLLFVRNKPSLGWQVKTRNEREIPLVTELATVLKFHLNGRCFGPVFRRRQSEAISLGANCNNRQMIDKELARRVSEAEALSGQPIQRLARLRLAKKLWNDLSAVREDRVRIEFMRLTTRLGLPSCTAPKVLRHHFATALQEGRVDPLIRNQLMGHVAAGERTSGHGLAMTAVYTHTRPETARDQLTMALAGRPALQVARRWLEARFRTQNSCSDPVSN